jgi:hypothetical protein
MHWRMPAGSPACDESFGELEAGERRDGGRFEDDRVAAGNGRSELVGDEIEGIVERGDGQHDADGHALEVARRCSPPGKESKGMVSPLRRLASSAGDGQGVDRAARLSPRLVDGLGAFAGDDLGEVLEVLLDDLARS